MDSEPPNLSGNRPSDEESTPLLVRRTIFKREESSPGAPSEQLANAIVFLGILQSQLRAEEERVSQLSSAAEPGRKVLQEKRLSRSGIPASTAADRSLAPTSAGFAPFAAPPEPGILPDSGWMSASEDMAGFVPLPLAPTPGWYESPAAALSAQYGPVPSEPPPRRRWPGLPIILLMIGGLGAAFAVGWYAHTASSRADSTPFPRPVVANAADDDYPSDQTVSADALAVADQMLDATNRGDLAAASTLLDDARRSKLQLPGLSYQAALLAFYRDDEEKLFLWTERSIVAHEAVPECWYLRASFQDRQSRYNDAVESLATAAQFAPFSPRYIFFRAEYYRRTGKPTLAVPIYQQALRCRPSTGDAELILFKQQMARLETGSDQAFQTELAQNLSREPVSGDTALLGAAQEINRSAFPAAAEYLRQAARTMPPNVLRNRLRDYFFLAQTKQKDIAEVLAAIMSPPAAGPTPPGGKGKPIVDPATRGLAEADPAGW